MNVHSICKYMVNLRKQVLLSPSLWNRKAIVEISSYQPDKSRFSNLVMEGGFGGPTWKRLTQINDLKHQKSER